MSMVTLKLMKIPETDEWKVAYYLDGKYLEGASYYTDDREDAELTLLAMAREAFNNGMEVEIVKR